MITNPSTGKPYLKYDVNIDKAARDGDNDLALELTIWQRQYYEMYCSDPDQLIEWRRRNG
jgi:hypothetical protein